MRPLQFPYVPLELDQSVLGVMAYVTHLLPKQQIWQEPSLTNLSWMMGSSSDLKRKVRNICPDGVVHHYAATVADDGIHVFSSMGVKKGKPYILSHYHHEQYQDSDWEYLFTRHTPHIMQWKVFKNTNTYTPPTRFLREFAYNLPIDNESNQYNLDGEENITREFPNMVKSALEANIDAAFVQFEHVPVHEISGNPNQAKSDTFSFVDIEKNTLGYCGNRSVFPLLMSLQTDPLVSPEHQRKLLEVHLKRRAVSLGGQAVGHYVGTNVFCPVA